MALTNIALIGANGNLGPSILSALLSAPAFTVTVLSRANSKSTYPANVKVITLPDSPSEADYASALTNIDAFITTFAGTNASLQITLANAAASAGVRLFIPADFGSCDSSSSFALSLMPLYEGKKRVREHLQSITSTTSQLSWTSIICGHFFDYGLASGLLLFDIQSHRATIVDGGDIRFSCSTLAQVGRAVVSILQTPEEVQNTMVYVQSFSLTQNQLLHACERATASKWHVEKVKSSEFIAENKAVLDKGYDHDASENLVGVVGIIDGDWTSKFNFANRILRLKEEDLENVVRKVVQDST